MLDQIQQRPEPSGASHLKHKTVWPRAKLGCESFI